MMTVYETYMATVDRCKESARVNEEKGFVSAARRDRERAEAWEGLARAMSIVDGSAVHG